MKGGARKLAVRMGIALALMAPAGCAATARPQSCISLDASAEDVRARLEASIERIRLMWVELSKKHETLLEELDALREEGAYSSAPISSRFVLDVTLPYVESTLRSLQNAISRLQAGMERGAGWRTLAQEGCSLESFLETFAEYSNALLERSFSEINAVRKAQGSRQEEL